MGAKKLYRASLYVIALVFIIDFILEIWKGTMFSSVSKFLVFIFFITAFLIERYKIKDKKENKVLDFASFLIILWFIVNFIISLSTLFIAREFLQQTLPSQSLNMSSIWLMIKGSTSDFGGFLLIPIIINLVGISINKYYHPKKKLRSWIHGGLWGIVSLIVLGLVLSLADTSCAQTNFLSSWGGNGCESISHYISIHISNFISSFFFMITFGLPVTLTLFAIFFSIGALIGHWIEDKR